MTLPKKTMDAFTERCLEGELTQAERATFFADLAEYERSEELATDKALQALDRLPQETAPALLLSNVMAAINLKRPPFHVRLRSWLERHSLLGWQVAGMAVTASLLFVMLAPQMSQPVHSIPGAPIPYFQMTAASPAGGVVAFRLYAPRAHSVTLVGDFNGWGSGQRVELHQQEDGTFWTAEVPLSPGSYQYAFLIDNDKMVTDPSAEQHVNDEFGRKNAVITVI
jgi:hypothetical protein